MTNPKIESLKQRLLNLSKKREISYQNIATAFLIEKLTLRIVSSKELSKKIIFKGGYVSLRVYGSPRFTVDLDALLKSGDRDLTLKEIIAAAEAASEDLVWFRHTESILLDTQSEYGGTRLVFRAGLGEPLKNLSKAQIINFDLGSGDPVTPSAVKITTVPLLAGEDELEWQVYPIETICSEKLHALITLGPINSRAKDLFDLFLFLPKCDRKILETALKNTFGYRDDELPSNIHLVLIEIDFSFMKRGWRSAVQDVSEATSFDECLNAVVAYFKSENHI